MSTEITLTVDDELMGDLRAVRRRQRGAGRRGNSQSELSVESDGDVVVGLIRDAYEGDIRRERNHGSSGGVVGADRQYSGE